MFQDKEENRQPRSIRSEVSFADIARFLKCNKTFIPLVTVAVSVLIFSSSFLVPQQYSKELTYSVELTRDSPSGETMTPLKVGYSMVDFLDDTNFSRAAVSSRYVESKQQVEVFIQSRNRRLLKKTDSRITALLETKLREMYGYSRGSIRLNNEPVSIAVVSSSDVERSRPRVTIGGLAIVSSFVMAVILGILRMALIRTR